MSPINFKPDADLTEKEFDFILVGTEAKPGLSRQTGWLGYHTLRSKGSQPGYPDWTLVKNRVVFIESKTEKGKVTDRQREWIVALHKAGAEVYVGRPRYLAELATVLGSLYRPPHGSPSIEKLSAELDALLAD